MRDEKKKQTMISNRLNKPGGAPRHDPFALDVISIRTVACKENSSYNSMVHKHSFYELHYALQNGCRFDVEGLGRVALRSNQFVIMSPHVRHSVDTTNEFSKLVFGFGIELNTEADEYVFYQNVLESARTCPICKATPFMNAIVRRLFKEPISALPGYRYEISYLLKSFLIEALGRMAEKIGITCTAEEDGMQDERFFMIKKFVQDNLSLGISRDDVADFMYLSTKQVDRIVKEHMGLTLSGLIDEEKVKRISHYLNETEMTLGQISERTGFSNEFSLSRFFSRQVGVSPTQYKFKQK